MISIIIPAFNEEKFLPLLLDSIRQQEYSNYEIIVADARSTDATASVAMRYGARVVEGGPPANGRNAGARVAQGDILIFLDADVIMPPAFLQNVASEMEERFLDLATCEILPLSDLDIDRFLHRFTNLYIRLSQYSNPHAPGFCIFVTRRLFNRVGGFDETLTMAEDHEFVKRASAFRPLRVLDSTVIQVSVRRLEKEGRLALAQKYIHVELYRMFKGEPRTEVVPYEFGNFAVGNNRLLEKQVLSMEKQMKRLTTGIIAFSKKYHTAEGMVAQSYQKQLDRFINRFDVLKEELGKHIRPQSVVRGREEDV